MPDQTPTNFWTGQPVKRPGLGDFDPDTPTQSEVVRGATAAAAPRAPMKTRAQFAADIKKMYPRYADVPDDKLVDDWLAKFPTYKDVVEGAIPTSTTATMLRAMQKVDAQNRGMSFSEAERPTAAPKEGGVLGWLKEKFAGPSMLQTMAATVDPEHPYRTIAALALPSTEFTPGIPAGQEAASRYSSAVKKAVQETQPGVKGQGVLSVPGRTLQNLREAGKPAQFSKNARFLPKEPKSKPDFKMPENPAPAHEPQPIDADMLRRMERPEAGLTGEAHGMPGEGYEQSSLYEHPQPEGGEFGEAHGMPGEGYEQSSLYEHPVPEGGDFLAPEGMPGEGKPNPVDWNEPVPEGGEFGVAKNMPGSGKVTKSRYQPPKPEGGSYGNAKGMPGAGKKIITKYQAPKPEGGEAGVAEGMPGAGDKTTTDYVPPSGDNFEVESHPLSYNKRGSESGGEGSGAELTERDADSMGGHEYSEEDTAGQGHPADVTAREEEALKERPIPGAENPTTAKGGGKTEKGDGEGVRQELEDSFGPEQQPSLVDDTGRTLRIRNPDEFRSEAQSLRDKYGHKDTAAKLGVSQKEVKDVTTSTGELPTETKARLRRALEGMSKKDRKAYIAGSNGPARDYMRSISKGLK